MIGCAIEILGSKIFLANIYWISVKDN